jgi:lipoate-protein ligase A
VRWRWLESAAADGATQMAVDAALLARAQTSGEAVLRVFSWTRPTLSFGRHETVRGRFDAATLDARGHDAVRRPTGGRVLLHDGEVTYSVTMPTPEGESVRDAFNRINHLLAAALARLGVRAEAAPGGRPLRPGGDACFAEPSAGELTVGGRKLVASAQRRDGNALLQHGSILLEDRQGALIGLASAPMAPPAPGAALRDVLGRAVTGAEVRAALRAALEAAAGPAVPLADADARALAEPLISTFADPQWTWRR